MEVEIKFENFFNILEKYIHDKSVIRKILNELNLNVTHLDLEEFSSNRGVGSLSRAKNVDPLYRRLEEIEKALEADKKAISDLFDRIIILEKMLSKYIIDHSIKHK